MLTVHRSERGDVLVDALADVLAVPAADPFRPELIAVPARGVERWIIQGLATRLGVAANIEFPTPAGLVAEAVAAASGIAPDDDPWRGERLVWLVLAAIDEMAFEPSGAVLARHLGVVRPGGWAAQPGHRPRRRYPTAELLAGLLRSYGANRPGMLVDWAAGRDTDGIGGELPEDLSWQAELFRRVRTLAGSPSPAERLEAACAQLRAEPGIVDLPERLSVYGPTRLPADQAAVLAALAVGREVHLWLPHPSPALWAELSGGAAPPAGPVPRTAGGPTATNPLLASLGREARELQARVAPLMDADVHHPTPPRAATLLGGVQSGIADDAPLAAGRTADGSIEFHACHGPARMIEVLRERLVRLFEDDPTLQPREVLVTCPDIETYAPLIRSAFGQAVVDSGGPGQAGEAIHPAQRLRVRLADRSLRFTNPLLDALVTVLELADGRATVAEVLDLGATDPVRRRFRFSDSDIERLREWAGPSGARWGLDEAARERYGLRGFPQNTLATALDRIVLGVVADETDGAWLGLGLPLDDVDSTDIDLVGRFAEYLDVLTRATAESRGRRPARDWAESLQRLVGEIGAVPAADAWQVTQAGRELTAALRDGSDRDLTLTEVRAMLGSRLGAKPTRANFRTGELTVCTLVPMRSVPHRVVVLLGLDDEVFPRSTRYSGDDVLGRTPCVGERDPRAEDRELFLDAVTSATDRLLVFYTGADPVKGTRRPPAVPVAELRDAARALLTDVDAAVGDAADDESSEIAGLEFRHPLQPFDPGNFDPDRFGLGAPFSYDPAAYAGARAAASTPEPVPPFLAAPLAASAVEDVDLDALVRFCEHPVKAFLRQRLHFTVPDQDDELAEALTIAPDGLQQWEIGERMLASALAGTPPERFAAAEMRRGTLPPFALGSAVLDRVAADVADLARVAGPHLVGAATTVDIGVDLGDGRRLVGSVPAVRPDGVVRASFSKLAAKHRVSAWVSLLALAAGGYEERSALILGRGYRGVSASRLQAPADPIAELRALVDLRDRGLAEPLPLFPKSSPAYIATALGGKSTKISLEAARAEFDGKFGDGTDQSIRYALGDSAFDDALGPPRGSEAEFSRAGTRFGALAARLWVPLLTHEELS
ncbi:exodeoxyribonuclease V subunit gamma [Tsukamurella spumae]|uniref:RecBCD enzyme subunit RecC n=1 Tax=Tsukamurella spumae TaxID=44753 RepID=A0A846X0N3_9ACTN|nr:exodeoxyribonuclease V subunit gamma [Tsukamurella spumae]NKY18743.1 exodeoxyribonuclease V subunit gamma [Tsukamurella spumae]